jgi:hypothetical protein
MSEMTVTITADRSETRILVQDEIDLRWIHEVDR